MTKFNHLFISNFIFVFASCWAQEVTKQEEEKAFKTAVYDKQIIQNIYKYTRLKDFLLDNLDTIINYRKTINRLDFIPPESFIENGIRIDKMCSRFTVATGPYDITLVPEFVRDKLDSLIKDLGKGMLANFTVCNDRTLVFDVYYINDYDVNNLNVLHELTWNKVAKIEDGYDFVKNTLLQDKWAYNICVFKEQGW